MEKKKPTLRYRLGVMRFTLSHNLKISLARLMVKTLSASDFDRQLGGKRLLVVSPHPDDEVLGCSGLIARGVASGTPPM